MGEAIRVVGLTGTNASGKGEVARYLVRKGFHYFSLSDSIRDELKRNGHPESRENMREYGNALRKAEGPGVLSERILPSLRDKSIVDSIRNPEEARVLERNTEFRFFLVDAPAELRFERAMERGRMENASTLGEFLAQEALESSRDPNALQLHACRKMVLQEWTNAGDLSLLYKQVDSALSDWYGT
ncbi:MAG: AAA family ATPase [Candidatus Omnitrophica bacterium]|nr:AAA family ATPase [Candidatus Omnitrophota bacterium]